MNLIAKDKLDKAAECLKERDIDLWLIYASEGSDPAVGLLFGMKTVGRTFFLLTKEGKRYAVCSIIDALESEESGLFDEVLKYRGDLVDTLRGLLDGIGPEKIAVNYSRSDHLCDGLTLGRLRYLKEILGEKYANRLVSSEQMLQKIRSIKNPEEVALIRCAVETTEEIFDDVCSRLRPGMSELEVGQLFIDGMSVRNVTLASTKDLSAPSLVEGKGFRSPGEKVLDPGHLLTVRFGVDYQGYSADITRTFYFLKKDEPEAPKSLEHAFTSVRAALSKAFDALKPGEKGSEGWMVYEAARAHLSSCGFDGMLHPVGYEIGRFVHDGGTVFAPPGERYGSAPYGRVTENMTASLVVAIPSGIGEFVLACGENVLVGTEKAKYLSRGQDKIFLVPYFSK